MRVMLDTNVLISAAVLSSRYILPLLDELAERHTIVLSTYVVDELKRVTKEKFPGKRANVEQFLRELPFELTYTPESNSFLHILPPKSDQIPSFCPKRKGRDRCAKGFFGFPLS